MRNAGRLKLGYYPIANRRGPEHSVAAGLRQHRMQPSIHVSVTVRP